MNMQNIYVYNRKDKIGKLIWYRGIVFPTIECFYIVAQLMIELL